MTAPVSFRAMTERDLMDLMWLKQALASGEAQRIGVDSGLSQRARAQASGITSPTLCRWESRQRVPTGAGAVRYARLLRKLQRRLAVPA